MSQLGTLHQFPRARVDRSTDADALRSNTSLDVPVAAPDMVAISGWQSLRLGAELALRSRWMFMAALAGVSLLALPGLLGVRSWAQQSAHAMVGLLVFTYGIARGVDGGSRARAFWAGLGAAPASMELGVVFVDLLFMALITAGGWLLGPDESVFLVLGAGAGLVTYGLGSATRSAARSESGRFGLILAMLLVVALNAGVAYLASYGHAVVGVAMQLGIVAAMGVAVRVLGSARWPESAAGRGRRSWAWVGVALSGLLVVPIQFLEGVPDGTGRFSTGSALMVPHGHPLQGQQVWRMGEDGVPERLGVRGRIRGWEDGPHGSATILRTSPWTLATLMLTYETDAEFFGALRRHEGAREGLIMADGGHVECDGVLGSGETRFDPDGMGATRTTESGVVWRLDADGCRRLSDGETP